MGYWDKDDKKPGYDPWAELQERDEEERRIFRERMYLLTNIDDIKERYADYIYGKLVLQNPSIISGDPTLPGNTSYNTSIKIILENIVFFEECFVLCNPADNGEPYVIEDAYRFTSFYGDSDEVRRLMEYMDEQKQRYDLSLAKDIGTTAATMGAKLYAGGKIGNVANAALNRANRLAVMAKHYDSGHATTMRVNRSIRGKAAQRAAFDSLFRKSVAYASYSTRYRVTGNALSYIAKMTKKGAFMPLKLLDTIMPADLGEGTSLTEKEKKRVTRLTIEELDIYCRKNTNYAFIVHQKHYE